MDPERSNELSDQIAHLEAGGGGVPLLPTPAWADHRAGPTYAGGNPTLPGAVQLLPTPEASDGSGGRRSAEMGGQRPSGSKRAVTLSTAVEHALLPTPRATDGTKGGPNQAGSSGDLMLPSAVHRLAGSEARLKTPRASRGAAATENTKRLGNAGPTNWGVYGPAVERWARVIGRDAPDPTEPGAKGGRRLSPHFVEFLMGLPDGHVTAVPGVGRNDQLKLLGNGVVPAQCAEAIRFLMGEGR